MIGADVIYLIAEVPPVHGAFNAPTYLERMVYCDVQSVSRNEYYRAREIGLEPTFVFILHDRAEYMGEKHVRYHGVVYDVIRTYIDALRVELTCEESKIVIPITTDPPEPDPE